MSQIIPKVDAAALASVAALAGDNIITEDELSLSRSGTQGGFSFDGSNDYLEGPIDDFGTSDFSLVFDILWNDAPSGVEYFAIKSGGNNRWYFYSTATQYILRIVDNGGATNTYTWTITPSVNHRSVIITADRSANATLYLNGESQGTQDISAQSAVDLGSGNTNPARIGFSTSSFDGKMFQVRYYNTLKTAGQVLNLAKGHNDTDSLWLHLSPTSTEDNLWVDISGNQRSFINNGATRIESQISKSFVSETELVSSRVGRGPAYYFDGTNDSIGDIDEAAINSNDFTWAVDINPADDAATYGVIYGLGSGGFTNRRYLKYEGGEYNVTIGDSSVPVASVEWPAQKANVIVTHDSATSTAKIYIDGKLAQEKVHTNQFDVNTSPMSNNVMDIGSLGSGTYFKGEISKVAIFNRALTAAEVELVSRGQSVGYADEGADGTADYESDFSAGVNSWVTSAGLLGLTGNNDTVSDGSTSKDDVLNVTSDASTGTHAAVRGSIVPGKRYRIIVEYLIPSGNTTTTAARIARSSDGLSLLELPVQGTWSTATGEFLNNSTSTAYLIRHVNATGTSSFTGTSGDQVHIASITFTPLGEVLKFLPESAATARWYNEGGAGSSANGTVVGATLINERKRGVFDNLYLDNVPSSDAGLIAGEIYRDNNGHLKIVI